ncbi:MAG: DUF4760 domain-containing protein [Bryobacteraceae bacterium]
MRIPIKFYIPILAVLLVLGIGAVWLHAIWTPDKSRTIEFASALIGGLTALYTLLLSVQQRRAYAAAQFMQRWNAPDFRDYRKAVRDTIDAKSAVGVENLLTSAILSFWEEVSIAVLHKEADEGLMKEFLFTPAIRYFMAVETHIQSIRVHKSQPTAYAAYERLYKRWCPKGT